jgi:hypothetical protein
MTDTVPAIPIRERLKDLNTKAYYLLVALSFIYRTSSESRSLKWAFTLTAIVAVLPVQDFIESVSWLKGFRIFKVICLAAALVFTIFWIWTASTP